MGGGIFLCVGGGVIWEICGHLVTKLTYAGTVGARTYSSMRKSARALRKLYLLFFSIKLSGIKKLYTIKTDLQHFFLCVFCQNKTPDAHRLSQIDNCSRLALSATHFCLNASWLYISVLILLPWCTTCLKWAWNDFVRCGETTAVDPILMSEALTDYVEKSETDTTTINIKQGVLVNKLAGMCLMRDFAHQCNNTSQDWNRNCGSLVFQKTGFHQIM